MANESIVGFARRLLQATEDDRIEWEKNPQHEPEIQESFVATAGGGSVLIAFTAYGSTALQVKNPNGDVIETLVTEPNRPGAWRDWEETVQKLFDSARLSALGTTRVLDKLSEEWELPPDPGSADIPF